MICFGLLTSGLINCVLTTDDLIEVDLTEGVIIAGLINGGLSGGFFGMGFDLLICSLMFPVINELNRNPSFEFQTMVSWYDWMKQNEDMSYCCDQQYDNENTDDW